MDDETTAELAKIHAKLDRIEVQLGRVSTCLVYCYTTLLWTAPSSNKDAIENLDRLNDAIDRLLDTEAESNQ